MGRPVPIAELAIGPDVDPVPVSHHGTDAVAVRNVAEHPGMPVEFKQALAVSDDDDPVVRLGDRPVLLGRMVLPGRPVPDDRTEGRTAGSCRQAGQCQDDGQEQVSQEFHVVS